MPQINSISDAGLARRMVDIIESPAGEGRAGEARRLGLTYVIEYASPGVSHADATLASRRRAVDGLLGGTLRARDDGRPEGAQLYSFDYMFPFVTTAIKPRDRENLSRFCLLRIPGISFADLDALLKSEGRNSYDFGYDLRNALNAARPGDEIGRHSLNSADPGQQVLRVAPDKPFDFTYTCHHEPPGDFSTIYGWEITALELPAAWDLVPPAGGVQFGTDTVVGHPDTGYSDHPALPQTRLLIAQGTNPADGTSDARDLLNASLFNSEPGHGTMTGSLIMSGSPANPVMAIAANRVVGCAPRAQLVPIRVCDSTAFVENSHVAQGVVWAVQQGCHMVSISVGGLWVPGIADAMQLAYDADMVVVAAAGNCEPLVAFPARYDACFAVGASAEDSSYWTHAAEGSAVAIAAPGVIVRSTWIKNDVLPIEYDYNWGSGTSFSTAFAGGVCALWLSFFGRQNLIGLNKGRLQDLFTTAAQTSAVVPAGWDTQKHGAGILNARALLQLDPATLPGTPPRSKIERVALTFLDFLGWAVFHGEDAQDQMLHTAMDWFRVDKDTALARLEDYGGEMVNALIEAGREEDDSGGHPIGSYTPDQMLQFFNGVGSYALKAALGG